MSRLIGKISATEKNPTTCDEFQFWLPDDTVLSPFDIVKVPCKYDGSTTYGVVQDILHITDSAGHISNYVSSDFGDVDAQPMTRRLSLSYAKVSVIHNTNENYMPLQEGQPVYTSDEDDIKIALGLDAISPDCSIPAGLMKASNNVNVPIPYNGEFLIGPEGAHLNVSGISGLATKTSYIMFLLKAIQHRYGEDVAIIAKKFGAWAGEINKKYRRGTSEATSALRDLSTLEEDQTRIEREIETGAISSDTKRDKLVAELDRITKKRERAASTVKKALERGTIDQERAETVERSLSKATASAKKIVTLTNKVVNADYATKNDLPSSYNRDERKLYQRIIEIIDMFFVSDPETAKKLRTEIVNELKVKKK